MARVAWREPPQSVFARATLPIGPSDACRRSSPSPSSPPTFSRSSDGEELRSRAPLFDHGTRVCVRACVYTCVCVRCVASVVVAHVCLVVGYANLTSLCAFVVRVCRVWPLPWLGKWDDPVVTRSEDHRGGAATGNQPRIDPVSRRLFSFSRLSFVGTTQRQPFRNCYCQLSSRIVYYLRRIY